MDDDTPDDVALRTLAAPAVRRPPARPGHGRRARHRRARSRPTTSVAFFAERYRPRQRWSSPSPDRSTTTRSLADVESGVRPADAGRRGAATRARRTARGRAFAIDDDTEQVHLVRRAAGRVRTRRPRPRGARRRQPRLRRRAVEPAVRRDPRAARPRLQRVLGVTVATPTPDAGRCTPARMPEHAGEVARLVMRARSTCSAATASPTRSSTSPSATSPAPTSSASRTPAPGWAASAGS